MTEATIQQPKRRRQSDKVAVLTADELRRLFSAITSKRDRAIFTVAYRHALRAAEIGLLHRADVDLKGSRITVTRLKGSNSGTYPMEPDTLKRIRSYLATRKDDSPTLFPSQQRTPIDRKMLWVLAKKYGELACLPEERQGFHVLKHSICTHLLNAGADLTFVQDWAGHKYIQNTMVYIHYSTTKREQGARKLFASNQVV